MAGKRITSLKQLVGVGKRRGAVLFANWDRHNSAAFVLNMQARIVARMIEIGLYEYRRGR